MLHPTSTIALWPQASLVIVRVATHCTYSCPARKKMLAINVLMCAVRSCISSDLRPTLGDECAGHVPSIMSQMGNAGRWPALFRDVGGLAASSGAHSGCVSSSDGQLAFRSASWAAIAARSASRGVWKPTVMESPFKNERDDGSHHVAFNHPSIAGLTLGNVHSTV